MQFAAIYTWYKHYHAIKKIQAASTNYLVTSFTDILRSVNFWLQSVARVIF